MPRILLLIAVPLGLAAVTAVILVSARRRGTLAGAWWPLQAAIALLIAVLVGLSAASWIP